MRQAHPQPAPHRHALERVRRRAPIRPAEQEAERREEDRDLPRLAEVLGDRVFEREADESGRDGRDDDRPCEPLGRRRDTPAAQRADPCQDELDHIAPEVRPDREDGEQEPELDVGELEVLLDQLDHQREHAAIEEAHHRCEDEQEKRVPGEPRRRPGMRFLRKRAVGPEAVGDGDACLRHDPLLPGSCFSLP